MNTDFKSCNMEVKNENNYKTQVIYHSFNFTSDLPHVLSLKLCIPKAMSINIG